ncbi:MAG TPA: PqqD family peptide modification chaperone [Thermoanaerobaculia bacterium]|nr:PqqD family peptide modification chaperone [Thermoanaerobaculia bacterium]
MAPPTAGLYPVPSARTFPSKEGETFFLLLDAEKHRLNSVGARILSLCDGTRTLAEVARQVAAVYEIDDGEAWEETCAFCDRLAMMGALVYLEAPAGRRWPSWQERMAPVSVTVEVTQRCNMRCDHCYNASGDEEPGTLRLAEVQGVLAELAALGTKSVSFAGGEPLMRLDLDEMLATAAGLGMATGIASNGFALTPSRADELVKLGVGTVQISLDYPDERHDDFRRRKGAFTHAEAAIRNASSRGLLTVVSTTLTRGNAADAGRIKARAQELGAAYHLVNRFIPVRRGASLDGDLSESDFLAAVEQLRDPAPPMISCDPVITGSVHCTVGSGHLTIASNGDVKPCVSFQASAGNVRREPLREIWRNSPFLIRLRERQLASHFESARFKCPSYEFATRQAAEDRAFLRVVS